MIVLVIMFARGGLETKSRRGNTPLEMYLKSILILEKAAISLKKSAKIIEIFIKAPHF
jgi:hypothetical protein